MGRNLSLRQCRGSTFESGLHPLKSSFDGRKGKEVVNPLHLNWERRDHHVTSIRLRDPKVVHFHTISREKSSKVGDGEVHWGFTIKWKKKVLGIINRTRSARSSKMLSKVKGLLKKKDKLRSFARLCYSRGPLF